MRAFTVAVVVAVVIACGALQAVASVALRDRAVPLAWVRALPEPVVRVVAAIPPAAIPTTELRLVLGRGALARGDANAADAFAASLGPGPDRSVLLGGIARARDDQPRALAEYLEAGDLPELEDQVEALVRAGDSAGALDLQRRVLARLEAMGEQRDTIGEATYRLGMVLQNRAYAYAPGDRRRTEFARAALAAFERATQLVPLNTHYLVALGNQSLNLSLTQTGRSAFARAHDIDPVAVEPLTGLADAALRAHDAPSARAYLTRARALAPDSPAIASIARRLGN